MSNKMNTGSQSWPVSCVWVPLSFLQYSPNVNVPLSSLLVFFNLTKIKGSCSGLTVWILGRSRGVVIAAWEIGASTGTSDRFLSQILCNVPGCSCEQTHCSVNPLLSFSACLLSADFPDYIADLTKSEPLGLLRPYCEKYRVGHLHIKVKNSFRKSLSKVL